MSVIAKERMSFGADDDRKIAVGDRSVGVFCHTLHLFAIMAVKEELVVMRMLIVTDII